MTHLETKFPKGTIFGYNILVERSADFITLATRDGRKLGHIDQSVLAIAPCSGPDHVDMIAIPIGKDLSVKEFQAMYTQYDVETDFLAHATWASSDSQFKTLDTGSQFVDQYGNFCYAFFHRWRDGSKVNVGQSVVFWVGGRFLVGRRKSSVL
jgi:hypothetical protein